MIETIDYDQFIVLFSERFPSVVADMDGCSRGLLHLEMGSLARATQTAISDENAAAVSEFFAFIDDVFRSASPDVKNAILVSFLEHLSFDGRHGKRIKARQLLSPRLQAELKGLEEYNAKLFGSSKQE